jgi:hypothetical protein
MRSPKKSADFQRYGSPPDTASHTPKKPESVLCLIPYAET